MKTFSISKFSLVLLLCCLPINFIVAEGIGSVYLSTLVIFINFMMVLFLTKGELIAKKNALFGLGVFGFFLLNTLLNVLFDKGVMIKEQLVFSVIHLQILLVFILSNYYSDYFTRPKLYKLLILSIVLFSFRIFIDDWDKVFNLSSVRGFRVEALFAGGTNNFALIIGIGFIICFFHLKKGFLKMILCTYFLAVIVLTMSRGALFGLIIALFVVALYDPKGKILTSLLRTSFILTLLGIVLLLYSDAAQAFALQFSERFLSLFFDDTSIEQASSGRGLIVRDLYKNHIRGSSWFEILFGHGMGSINFVVNGSPYESSHNFIVDVFYRNGILVLIGFISLLVYLTLDFIGNRRKTDLVLFGIFVFLHFEILVNPFVYAAQTGWIYGLFLALIINRKKLGQYEKIKSVQN